MDKFDETVEELIKHLACTNQNWLFGAGISFGANIPLMNCLTGRVSSLLPLGEMIGIYQAVTADLPDGYHIEHVLSHLGDHIAIAERSKSNNANVNGINYSSKKLHGLHAEIIKHIGETIRYGYCKENATTGVLESVGTTEPVNKNETYLILA